HIEKGQDDEDNDEEPSAASNRRSKRRSAKKEPKLTSAPKEKTSKSIGKSTEGSKSHHKSASESAQVEEPMHISKGLKNSHIRSLIQNKTLPTAHGPTQPWISNVAWKDDSRLLAALTFELMKRSCKSLVELEYFFKQVYKATTDQLD
nr:hypothetical protein [Tanacetum cinerariifolium]